LNLSALKTTLAALKPASVQALSAASPTQVLHYLQLLALMRGPHGLLMILL
jgi:hypothetical protein